MGGNARQRPSEPGRPLTIRAIVLGGVFVGLVGAGAVVALLHFYGGGTNRDRAGLDVVRTAGTLVVGTGGAIALLLTARRQRSTELTLEHQRQVAEAAERNVVEQRVTELYTHAVDQLGNDKAPVRLGGLHALERLAQNNPDHRQTIVDVICAYLRMPYTPPADDAPAEAHTRYENRRQELQVRLTAQRILAAHLQPDATDAFWDEIDLDLSEAHLYGLDLTGCHIQKAQFGKAQFSGDAEFEGVRFSGDAVFGGAQFSAYAGFSGAQFSGYAVFGGAQFSGIAGFSGAQFGGDVLFGEAQFGGVAGFSGAQFGGYVLFGGAQFSGDAWFGGAQFSGVAGFGGARVRPNCSQLWPAGWTTRGARTTEGEEEGWMYLVRVDDSTE